MVPVSRELTPDPVSTAKRRIVKKKAVRNHLFPFRIVRSSRASRSTPPPPAPTAPCFPRQRGRKCCPSVPSRTLRPARQVPSVFRTLPGSPMRWLPDLPHAGCDGRRHVRLPGPPGPSDARPYGRRLPGLECHPVPEHAEDPAARGRAERRPVSGHRGRHAAGATATLICRPLSMPAPGDAKDPLRSTGKEVTWKP